MISLVPVDRRLAPCVDALYLGAFPAVERLPPERLHEYADSGLADYYAIVDEEFRGLAYIVHGGSFEFLLYFAIAPSSRGMGYGSEALGIIKGMCGDRRLYLNMEPLDDCAPNASQRVARKAFYERNGLRDNGNVVTPQGETYAMMSWNGPVTAEEANRYFVELERVGLFAMP